MVESEPDFWADSGADSNLNLNLNQNQNQDQDLNQNQNLDGDKAKDKNQLPSSLWDYPPPQREPAPVPVSVRAHDHTRVDARAPGYTRAQGESARPETVASSTLHRTDREWKYLPPDIESCISIIHTSVCTCQYILTTYP